MMNTLSLTTETTIQRVEETMCAPLDNDLVLFNVQSGRFFGLDDISTRVWELLEQPQSISAVCDQLAEEYDVDRTTCETDVLELVEGLCHDQLAKAVAA